MKDLDHRKLDLPPTLAKLRANAKYHRTNRQMKRRKKIQEKIERTYAPSSWANWKMYATVPLDPIVLVLSSKILVLAVSKGKVTAIAVTLPLNEKIEASVNALCLKFLALAQNF